MPRKSTKKTTEEQQQPQTNGNHFDPGNSLQPVGEHQQQQQLAMFPQNGMFQHHWNPHFSLPFSAYPNLNTPISPNPYFGTNMFGFGGFPMGGTHFGAFQPNLFQQNQQLMQYQMKYASTNRYIQYMTIYNSIMAHSISMQLAQTPFDPALVPETNSKRNLNEDENTGTPKKKKIKKSKEESLPIAETQPTEELLVDVVSLDNAYLVSSQSLNTSTQPVEKKATKTDVRAQQGGISMSIEKLLGLTVDNEPAPKKKKKSKTAVSQPNGSPSTLPPDVVDSSSGNNAKTVVENKVKSETAVGQENGGIALTTPSHIVQCSSKKNAEYAEKRKKSETATPQNDTIPSTSPPDVVENFMGNDANIVEKTKESGTAVSQQTGSNASTAPSRMVESSLGPNVKAVENTQKSKISDVCQQNDTITSTSPPDVVENSLGNDANTVEKNEKSETRLLANITAVSQQNDPIAVESSSGNEVNPVGNTQESRISDVPPQTDIIVSTSPSDVVENASGNGATTVETTEESETAVSQQNGTNDSESPPQMNENSSENNAKTVVNTQEPKPDAPQQNNAPPPATVVIDITFTLEDERELRILHGQYLKQPRCSTTRELLFEEWAQRIVEGEKDDMKMKKALALSRSIIRRRWVKPEIHSDTINQTANAGTKRKVETDPIGNQVLKTARKEPAEFEQEKEESQSDEDEGNQIASQEPQVPDDKDAEEKEPVQPAENDDAKN